MATFGESPHRFVEHSFLPMIGVVASESVEEICEKNNLSFVELIEPFSTVSQEGGRTNNYFIINKHCSSKIIFLKIQNFNKYL